MCIDCMSRCFCHPVYSCNRVLRDGVVIGLIDGVVIGLLNDQLPPYVYFLFY